MIPAGPNVAAPADSARRSEAFEVRLPAPAGKPLRAGSEVLFGLVVLGPAASRDAASEWYWPSSLTTQPLENPLLWARLRLRSP